ncbi:hypothetical protein QW060_06605 [Myroides ceti]|uniref:Uncharacterized protein n=1 Tax=Paenimyroides ceti TaxID=395087 RepID=A0ABT8CS68_9FLAO|nr:hypothetical protein [Paenimyroides ceti]MDN3706801.1 hypothetical protein [Paenimyroides ceti]
MTEWLKAHVWKVCILQKGSEDLNSFLSAKKVRHYRRTFLFCIYGSASE